MSIYVLAEYSSQGCTASHSCPCPIAQGGGAQMVVVGVTNGAAADDAQLEPGTPQHSGGLTTTHTTGIPCHIGGYSTISILIPYLSYKSFAYPWQAYRRTPCSHQYFFDIRTLGKSKDLNFLSTRSTCKAKSCFSL